MKETGAFNALLDVTSHTIIYAKEHPGALRWKNGAALPQPAEIFIPQFFFDYARSYFQEETPEGDERAFTLAQLLVQNYPSHSHTLNLIAACYFNKKEFPKAREYFKKAHQAEPKDALVLSNLGRVCHQLDDIPAAREYFKKVIALNPATDILQEAQAALKMLDEKKK